MNYILAILFGATVSLSFYFPVDKPNSVYGKAFETSSPQLNIKIASINFLFSRETFFTFSNFTIDRIFHILKLFFRNNRIVYGIDVITFVYSLLYPTIPFPSDPRAKSGQKRWRTPRARILTSISGAYCAAMFVNALYVYATLVSDY